MGVVKEKLKAKINNLKKSSFIKSVLTISSGIIIAQGINFFLVTIYSRIYLPEIFGDFSVMTSSGTIISSVICLGLLMAIMLPKDDEAARRICTLILVSLLTLGTIILGIILLIAPYWQAFSVSIPYWQGCLIMYLYLVLSNIASLFYSYTNRKAFYKVLFWNPIIGVIFNGTLTIGLGLLGWGLVGYAIGTLSVSVVNIIHMSRYVKPFNLRSPRILFTLKEYKNFPLFQLPANVISTVSSQLPIQMLSHLFGNTVLGIYSMTVRFLDIPILLLAGPINRVYYREASVKYADGQQIGEFTFKIIKTNIKMAIIPIAILMVFGEQIFAFILGEAWRMAGVYAEVLGVYTLVHFSSACVSGGFVIVGKQKYNLMIAIIAVLSNTVVFIVGNLLFGDVYRVLICFVIINIAIKLTVHGWFICDNGVKVTRFMKFIGLYIAVPSGIAIGLKIFLKTVGVL